MERFFKLRDHGTTVVTEFIAGITTFLAMAYIVFVNPSILSQTGMPSQAFSLMSHTLWLQVWALMPFSPSPSASV